MKDQLFGIFLIVVLLDVLLHGLVKYHVTKEHSPRSCFC
jgi:hypothetical protein